MSVIPKVRRPRSTVEIPQRVSASRLSGGLEEVGPVKEQLSSDLPKTRRMHGTIR